MVICLYIMGINMCVHVAGEFVCACVKLVWYMYFWVVLCVVL